MSAGSSSMEAIGLRDPPPKYQAFKSYDEVPSVNSDDRPPCSYRLPALLFLVLSLLATVLVVTTLLPSKKIESCGSEDWVCLMQQVPSAARLAEHLQQYTQQPHLAGSAGDYETALYTLSQFRQYGLTAEIMTHEVVLNTPVRAGLAIIGPPGEEYIAPLSENILSQDSTSDTWERNHSFIGYSPSGNVIGALVYANYGMVEDFSYLRETLGLNLTNTIALVRYGRIYRGLKARFAFESGCAGLIIFSDPSDDGFVKGPVWPEGPWRPASSTQRGSGMFLPLCPGDPYRLSNDPSICNPYSSQDVIPQIPVLPISYGDALPLLSSLSTGGRNFAPAEWQGGLQGITYFIGPGPTEVELLVENNFSSKTMWNVRAEIPGEEEPEKLVILGNHRDAWVFGAVDPSSGSSQLLEVAFSFAQLLAKGWRPRRTLMFFSWDGEEYGLIGSTWLGEKWAERLGSHAVAYLNVDMSHGDKLRVEATPQLTEVVYRAACAIPDPWADASTTPRSLYDRWEEQTNGTTPPIAPLGSGSDYTVFLDHLGIISIDLRFEGDYGVYHSVYDSYSWMETVGDPGFLGHKATAQLWGLIALDLSSSPVLPLDYTSYGSQLLRYLSSLSSTFDTSGVNFDMLRDGINAFILAAEGVQAYRNKIESELIPDGDAVAELNAVLQLTERRMLDPAGLAGRTWFKHYIFAPGLNEGYQSRPFPSLYQPLYDQNYTLATEQVVFLTQLLATATDYLRSADRMEHNPM
eukprot:gb/GEZN01003130.1/.p1 GENE.gb/GEZN01003130.1/~~gb/GEZN01003130.1/.p1  ORF type:complete len:747 (-),score=73.73 gb/GEZN01003130.1/:5-2245(-)